MTKNHNKTRQRLPDLSSLSILILENLVEKVISKSAIEEIKKPYAQKEIADSLSNALSRVEADFLKIHSDHKSCSALLQLPIYSLPSVQNAIWAFYERPNTTQFSDILKVQMMAIRSLNESQINNAITLYLKLLKREFININSELREKIQTLALLDIADTLGEVKEFIQKEEFKTSRSQLTATKVVTEKAQLILEGEFNEFNETKQLEIIKVLAALLHVHADNIKILRVLQGSIVIEFELDQIAINRLSQLIEKNDFRVRKLGILGLRLSNGKTVSVKSTLKVETLRDLLDRKTPADRGSILTSKVISNLLTTVGATVLLVLVPNNPNTGSLPENLSHTISNKDNSSRLVYENGLHLYKTGRNLESLQSFQRTIELAPKFVSAYFSAAKLCQELHKFIDSVKYLLKATEVNVSDTSQLFREILESSAAQQITTKQLRKLPLKQLTKSQKHSPNALILQSMTNLLLGNLSNSMQCLKLAEQQMHNDYFIRLLMCMVEMLRGNLSAAVVHAEHTIIILDRGHRGFVYYILATLMQEQGLYDRAIYLYNESIKDYNLNSTQNYSVVTFIYFQLATCLYQVKNEKDALIAFEKAHSNDPDCWAGRLSKIILLIQNGKTDDVQKAAFEFRRMEKDVKWENESKRRKIAEWKAPALGYLFDKSLIEDSILPLLTGAILVGDTGTIHQILNDENIDIIKYINFQHPIFNLSPINWVKDFPKLTVSEINKSSNSR